MWVVAYVAVLAALFVRVRTPGTPAVRPQAPLPAEPLSLVMLHHRIFYALLLLAPVEALLLGGRPGWRVAGLLSFAAGVLLYRVGGAHLGSSLSPFVLPRRDGRMVMEGLYAWVRHPMYLGQALIAVGAPMTLGSRWVAWLALPALAVLAVRIRLEEAALREQFADYRAYQAATRRLLPFLF
jgi:protein-S-isoprenylcysteine O-methyltransferase Ste14